MICHVISIIFSSIHWWCVYQHNSFAFSIVEKVVEVPSACTRKQNGFENKHTIQHTQMYTTRKRHAHTTIRTGCQVGRKDCQTGVRTSRQSCRQRRSLRATATTRRAAVRDSRCCTTRSTVGWWWLVRRLPTSATQSVRRPHRWTRNLQTYFRAYRRWGGNEHTNKWTKHCAYISHNVSTNNNTILLTSDDEDGAPGGGAPPPLTSNGEPLYQITHTHIYTHTYINRFLHLLFYFCLLPSSKLK